MWKSDYRIKGEKEREEVAYDRRESLIVRDRASRGNHMLHI